MSDERLTENDESPTISRRSVVKAAGVTTVGLAGMAGTASATKHRKRKRKTAKAGWVLTGHGDYEKFKHATRFKVLKRKKAIKLPAGCGPKSTRKRYVRYKVKYWKNGCSYKEYLYRRKNQPQLKVGATYRIKKVHRCDVRGRVLFKRKKTQN